MPVTQIGLVYYSDDPHKRVFRRVYPQHDDSELDQPPTDGNGTAIMNGSVPHTWTDFGVDTARPVAMDKVSAVAPPIRLRGTPTTPASEPVVYYVNVALLVAANAIQTQNNLNALTAFVGAGTTWSNFFDLGSGTPSTVIGATPFPPASPSWIVVVGGGNPGFGTQHSSTTIGGQAVALWVV